MEQIRQAMKLPGNENRNGREPVRIFDLPGHRELRGYGTKFVFKARLI
jgi:hypothetical protein